MADHSFLCRSPPLPPPHKMDGAFDLWLHMSGSYAAKVIVSGLGRLMQPSRLYLVRVDASTVYAFIQRIGHYGRPLLFVSPSPFTTTTQGG